MNSLVFSYWTSTLNLLGQMLKNKGVRFERIDGQVSYTQRLSILDRFAEDTSIKVLLMTIESGAVG
jgi:SWI/SNF-related matrix-associated actin-dependent regulator of chromatin subfamily A3